MEEYKDKIIDSYMKGNPDKKDLIKKAKKYLKARWYSDFIDIFIIRQYELFNYYKDKANSLEELHRSINHRIKDCVPLQKLSDNFYKQLPIDIIKAIETETDNEIHRCFDVDVHKVYNGIPIDN